jgi:hypothetical protein
MQSGFDRQFTEMVPFGDRGRNRVQHLLSDDERSKQKQACKQGGYRCAREDIQRNANPIAAVPAFRQPSLIEVGTFRFSRRCLSSTNPHAGVRRFGLRSRRVSGPFASAGIALRAGVLHVLSPTRGKAPVAAPGCRSSSGRLLRVGS